MSELVPKLTGDGFEWEYDRDYWYFDDDGVHNIPISKQSEFALRLKNSRWYQGQNPIAEFYAERLNAIKAYVARTEKIIADLEESLEVFRAEIKKAEA